LGRLAGLASMLASHSVLTRAATALLFSAIFFGMVARG